MRVYQFRHLGISLYAYVCAKSLQRLYCVSSKEKGL